MNSLNSLGGSELPASGDLVVEQPVASQSMSTDLPSLAEAVQRLAGRAIWHVNTTALGGGVAEVIRTTVSQHNAAGLRSRWLVTRGAPDFFTLTKQLHHLLHSMPGSGHLPARTDQEMYRSLTKAQAHAALQWIGPADVAVLHDPQTLGLAPVLHEHGRAVIWRCHIGSARPSRYRNVAWSFLAPYAEEADRLVFSLANFVPPQLAERPVTIIPPGLDPSSPRCQPLGLADVHRVLAAVGLHRDSNSDMAPAGKVNIAELRGAARVIQDEPVPENADVILQLARWDPLKDMSGVLKSFADYIAPHASARLILAGPDPDEIADDLENRTVLAGIVEARGRLPLPVRRRVHLVVLRLSQRSANQLLVNALIHRATTVVQKSLEEGFALISMEAMYHSKPLVASAVGGLAAQITDHEHGLLVPPHDYAAFGAAVCRLLTDRSLADRLAGAARAHCEHDLLVSREHERIAELVLQVAGLPPGEH